MKDETLLEPPRPATGGRSLTVRRRSTRLIWTVPALLCLAFSLWALFTPVQTRQFKAGQRLEGAAAARLAYDFRFEHPEPRALSLQLAAAGPVEARLLQEGRTVLTRSLRPPAGQPGPVELRLPGGVWTGPQGAARLELDFNDGPWAVAYSRPDVYRPGRLSLDGAPATNSDLFFVAGYGPDPLLRLKVFWESQNRWGGYPWLALGLLALALGLVFGGLARLARDPAGWPQRTLAGRPAYLRFSGYLLATALAGMLALSLLNPPLQGPDEPGHVGRIIAGGRGVTMESLKPETAALMSATGFVDRFAFLTYEQEPADLFPPTAEFYQSQLYYSLGTVLVGLAQPFQPTFTTEVYLARLSTVFFALGTIGASLAAGWLLRRDNPWLALALPLTVAFLPQALFLYSLSNNDNAAICCAAWAAAGLLLLYKNRAGWRVYLPGLVFILVMLGLGVVAKRTAITVVPGYMLGLWLLVLLQGSRRVRLALAGATLAGLALAVVGFLIAAQTGPAARGWYLAPFNQGVHAVRTEPGPDGPALALLARPVEQPVDVFYRPEVERVFLQGRARGLDGQPAELKIELVGLDKTLAETSVALAGNDWTTLRLEAAVPPEISASRFKPYVLVRFSGRRALLDDLALRANRPDGPNLLVNPALDETTPTLAGEFKGRLEEPARARRAPLNDALDLLTNGRGLPLDSSILQSLAFVTITSWGGYGWGQLFLSPAWLVLWAVVTAAAVIGLARATLKRDFTVRQLCFGLSCLAALAGTFALQQAYIMLDWLYIGKNELVAGRYLFVALLPGALLLLRGLQGLWPARVGPEESAGTPTGPGWAGLWAWSVWLLAMNLAGLLLHLLPFYYN